MAVVTINMMLGNNGIFEKAKQAQSKMNESQQNDIEGINYLNNVTSNYINLSGSKFEEISSVTGIKLSKTEIGTDIEAKLEVGERLNLNVILESETTSTQNIIWSSSNTSVATVNTSGVVNAVAEGFVTITATVEGKSEINAVCNIIINNPISTTTSYVGYYADVDGDGIVDGVIFADLLIGGSGRWQDSNGEYSITTISSAKKYTISQQIYEGKFGTAPVLKAVGRGNDRFYVMSLTDLKSSNYCWYASAYSNKISDYSTVTLETFGTGKANTETMIEKWNNSSYGSQNLHPDYPDLWDVVQEKYEKGWFIPSKEEFAAFLGTFKIKANNNYGLASHYWTSSLRNHCEAWLASVGFSRFYIYNGYDELNRSMSVRLCASF